MNSPVVLKTPYLEHRCHASSCSLVIAHLAGLVVDVEGGDGGLAGLAALLLHQVLGQPGRQVGLACSAGAGEDDATVLQQQGDVALQHGLGDERLKHQAVLRLLTHTCRGRQST